MHTTQNKNTLINAGEKSGQNKSTLTKTSLTYIKRRKEKRKCICHPGHFYTKSAVWTFSQAATKQHFVDTQQTVSYCIFILKALLLSRH